MTGGTKSMSTHRIIGRVVHRRVSRNAGSCVPLRNINRWKRIGRHHQHTTTALDTVSLIVYPAHGSGSSEVLRGVVLGR